MRGERGEREREDNMMGLRKKGRKEEGRKRRGTERRK